MALKQSQESLVAKQVHFTQTQATERLKTTARVGSLESQVRSLNNLNREAQEYLKQQRQKPFSRQAIEGKRQRQMRKELNFLKRQLDSNSSSEERKPKNLSFELDEPIQILLKQAETAQGVLNPHKANLLLNAQQKLEDPDAFEPEFVVSFRNKQRMLQL